MTDKEILTDLVNSLREKRLLGEITESKIVFDTSAILNIYFYSEYAQNVLTNILEKFKGKVFIPGQVYYEFLKNKNAIIDKPIHKYKVILSGNGQEKEKARLKNVRDLFSRNIEETLKNIETQIKSLKEETKNLNSHPYIDSSVFKEIELSIVKLKQSAKEFQSEEASLSNKFKDIIKTREEEFSKQKKVDRLHTVLRSISDIGEQYSYTKQLEIAYEGRNRYSEKIPPGYMDDKEKVGLAKYGDLFAWLQIIEEAKDTSSNYVFVIDDNKEDWWDLSKGKANKSPRYELLIEFKEKTGKDITFLNSSDFFHRLNDFKSIKINSSVLKEIEEKSAEADIEKYDLAKIIDFFIDKYNAIDVMASYAYQGSPYLYHTMFSLEYKTRDWDFISAEILDGELLTYSSWFEILEKFEDKIEDLYFTRSDSGFTHKWFVLLFESKANANAVKRKIDLYKNRDIRKRYKKDMKVIYGYFEGEKFHKI